MQKNGRKIYSRENKKSNNCNEKNVEHREKIQGRFLQKNEDVRGIGGKYSFI